MTENNDIPLNIEEAAQVLRVSRPVILRLLNSGQLRGRKVGRAWRILRSEIDAFLQTSEPKPKKKKPAAQEGKAGTEQQDKKAQK